MLVRRFVPTPFGNSETNCAYPPHRCTPTTTLSFRTHHQPGLPSALSASKGKFSHLCCCLYLLVTLRTCLNTARFDLRGETNNDEMRGFFAALRMTIRKVSVRKVVIKQVLRTAAQPLNAYSARKRHSREPGPKLPYPAFSSSVSSVSECFFTISAVIVRSPAFLLPGT